MLYDPRKLPDSELLRAYEDAASRDDGEAAELYEREIQSRGLRED
jgi:hypothetical protein